MKKIAKKLFLAALTTTLGLTMISCGNNDAKEERNTSIPYGAYADKLDSVVATSGSGDNQLTVSFETYYNRLRKDGYDIILNNIKKELYSAEYNAIYELVNSNDISNLSSATKKALNFKDNADDEYQEITDTNKLNELKKEYTDEFYSKLANEIFKVSSAESFDTLTQEEINKLKDQYYIAKMQKGYVFPDYNGFKNSSFPSYNLEDNTFDFDLSIIDDAIEEEILIKMAETLYTKKQLYIIADEEYLTVDDKEEKNDDYFFNDEEYEERYEKTYQTFGTYNVILIQFNNIKEAYDTMNKAINSTTIDENNALESYLKIYKEYYKYKFDAGETIDENYEDFIYTINDEEDNLSDLNTSIQTLITSTLENGGFLVEPRNINNKYVLAYKVKTTYDVSGTDEETLYADLTEAQKEHYIKLIQDKLIDANASSYVSDALKNAIKEVGSELKIFDPLFEYRFEYNYSDSYDLIAKNDFKGNENKIYTINGKDFTVEDFFTIANKRLGANIITDQFQLEFATQFIDNEEYITTEAIDKNKEALNNVVNKFKNDENSTYPVEVGLETFLINTYGYNNEDDALKYYYNAKNALSSYLSKNIYTEWVNDDQSVDLDVLEQGILGNILKTGNTKYEDLFEINVDHILINIDANADGSPDDPDQFIKDNPEIEEDFVNEVVKLAQALYEEASYEDYADNTLFENLQYLVKAYNKGETLRSNPSKTWDDFKKYNFLLTAEQLASSGNIDQDSVSKFVTPFADYLKGMNKTAEKNVEYENGEFFLYNTVTKEGAIPTSSTEISADTLCKTVYGYHLIVLNENKEPESLKFTSSDDPLDNSVDIKLLIKEDKEDEENNIVAIIEDLYNEETSNAANMKQLFVYYIQLKKGADSSLDGDIEAIMASLFNDAINTYSSTNFQTLLLLQKLDIKADDKLNEYLEYKILDYKNQITKYGEAQEYTSWVDGSLDWTRPDSI